MLRVPNEVGSWIRTVGPATWLVTSKVVQFVRFSDPSIVYDWPGRVCRSTCRILPDRIVEFVNTGAGGASVRMFKVVKPA